MGVLHNWAALGGGLMQGGDKVILVPLGTCVPQGDSGCPEHLPLREPSRGRGLREEPGRSSPPAAAHPREKFYFPLTPPHAKVIKVYLTSEAIFEFGSPQWDLITV